MCEICIIEPISFYKTSNFGRNDISKLIYKRDMLKKLEELRYLDIRKKFLLLKEQ